VALIDRLEDDLTSIPAVSSATIATVVPGFGGSRRPVAIEGVDGMANPHLPDTRYFAATPDYFATFGASMLAGRMFDARDGEDGLPIAVVNRTFERTHFPNGAVGRRVAFPTDARGVE
jgi:hypothetical protein